MRTTMQVSKSVKLVSFFNPDGSFVNEDSDRRSCGLSHNVGRFVVVFVAYQDCSSRLLHKVRDESSDRR